MGLYGSKMENLARYTSAMRLVWRPYGLCKSLCLGKSLSDTINFNSTTPPNWLHFLSDPYGCHIGHMETAWFSSVMLKCFCYSRGPPIFPLFSPKSCSRVHHGFFIPCNANSTKSCTKWVSIPQNVHGKCIKYV